MPSPKIISLNQTIFIDELDLIYDKVENIHLIERGIFCHLHNSLREKNIPIQNYYFIFHYFKVYKKPVFNKIKITKEEIFKNLDNEVVGFEILLEGKHLDFMEKFESKIGFLSEKGRN